MDLEAAFGFAPRAVGRAAELAARRAADHDELGANMLSKEDRGRVEGRLQAERARALEALGDFDEQRSESLQERAGELNSYRLHQADVGTEAMDQETQFLLASGQGDRLYQIDDALRRLYDDPERFGLCRECGETISTERLDVVPETDLCAVHAGAAEA